MKKLDRLSTLGISLFVISLGLNHLNAPHWLVLTLTIAAIVLLVVYLGQQTGLRQRKLAWLRGLLGRK